MKTIRVAYGQPLQLPASACAIGYFDGLHKGHQQLIETAVKTARENGIQSAVLTFDPDPWKVLRPDADLSHMTDLQDKEKLLASMGVDQFLVVEFTREFAGLSVDAFHEFLHDLRIDYLICGFDYSYGARGAGNVNTLKQTDLFVTDVISEISEEAQKISSTRIEKLIREGEIEKANELLGYMYSLKGKVVHGYERGRVMGFPTANLDYSRESILPARGVYAGYLLVDGQLYPAMINVGKNPTFQNKEVSVEAYAIDAKFDLYDKEVRFFFATRLRPEKKFASVDELKAQLTHDARATVPALKPYLPALARTAKLWSLGALDDILKQ